MKKNNNKGFTLAELLIVVAIIAVLVAIAIPVFTTLLERAREATDLANIRSAYAEVVTDYLSSGAKEAKSSGAVSIKQQDAAWHIDHVLNIRVNGVETPYEVPNVTVGGTATVNVDKDGGVTVTFGGATPAGG